MKSLVGVLFARKDSIYKTLDNVDVWDIDRDARGWAGGNPVVAHPPCRSWGRLRQFAKPKPGEKLLALKAVGYVRESGGVLEHPACSTLWRAADLPLPGRVPIHYDIYGGWTLQIEQHAFGHRAEKKTWLYICGCAPEDIPKLPVVTTKPTHCIRPTKNYPRLPSVTKAEREHTPVKLAEWLVELAKRCAK